MNLPKHIEDAIHEYIPVLEGWTEPDKACEIAELVISNDPKVVVEIGTFGGRSAIAQAFALRQNNSGGKIYCIDPWRLEYALEGESSDNRKWWSQNINIDEIHTKCMHAIWQHNLDEWLVVIRAASQHVYQLFPEIDMLLIDGNHSEVASFRDVQLYLPRVNPNGYIWLDDTDWVVRDGEKVLASTKKAVELIETQCTLVKDMGKHRLYQKQ